MMPAIDQWVIRHTISLIKSFPNISDKLCVSINLSGQSLGSKNFIHSVISLIDEANINPECLCFEITETAAIENFQQARRFISVLHGMGSTFALDDFGSGMSSFSYLKHLPVDFIKIDGTFVKNICESRSDLAMVKAISQVGISMGVKTIAEFVEAQDITNSVNTLGIDYAQGYGIEKPQPISRFLKEHYAVAS